MTGLGDRPTGNAVTPAPRLAMGTTTRRESGRTTAGSRPSSSASLVQGFFGYRACSPGTLSWIAKEAFVLTGDAGVVTYFVRGDCPQIRWYLKFPARTVACVALIVVRTPRRQPGM